MTNQDIIPADQVLPNKLLLLPLNGKPLFPGIFTPMMVSDPESINVVEQAIETNKMIGLVLAKNGEESEESDVVDFYSVGTAAKIVKKMNLPDGGYNIFVSTLKRFEIKKILQYSNPAVAAVEYPQEINSGDDEVQALTRSLISEMKQVSENNPLFSEEMRLNMVNIDQPGKIADFITSILNIDRDEQQKILETFDIRKRMEQVLIFIKKEQELLKIQKKIQKQINEKIEKSQRNYFLKEELKAIKQELGMPTDSKSNEYLRFKEAVEQLEIGEDIREQIDQELEKFQLMDPNSSEFIVTRNYLDTIISLPWNDEKKTDIDLKKSEQVLEEDHYGLEDVKKRILEYLATRKLRKDTKGSIICLVGPPGVGKTSLGKSVARALDKKFFRFSVGGMRDEAEIKGHRRTYVGAMPGKIIQGLKIVKSKTPVFMIDEIDKLGASYQGDPSSALLEVLDPEQNAAFRDNYLDLPFDISGIFFIATANTLDSIPLPLQDRMEIIRMSGYLDSEKMEIAKKYLIPKSLEKTGLKKKNVKYKKSALTAIAEGYAREAGVRNFEKSLDKIHRKVALKIVRESESKSGNGRSGAFSIGKENIEEYLGKPHFREDEVKTVSKPGMAIGLAWTPFGGDTLLIEAVSNPGKEGFKLTGQMGTVMQESAGIAYTYIRHLGPQFNIPKVFFEENQIHLHIPAGATPKDGPSAGITMATSLLTLAMGKKMKKNIAMTGELSLTGHVLPIGGLKEKIVAAKRNKVKEIIIPEKNLSDLEEIPDYIKKGVTFHPVNTMEMVIEKIF